MIRTVLHELSLDSFAKQCGGEGCPICGLPARIIGDVRTDSQFVACRRCGGFQDLIYSDVINRLCKDYDFSQEYGRALISYYIHKEWLEQDKYYNDYQSSNIHYAKLDYNKLSLFLQRGAPSMSEQISECMELIGSEMGRNGRYTPFSFAKKYGLNVSWEFTFPNKGGRHHNELSDEERISMVPQFYLEVVRTLCVSDVTAVEYFFANVLCKEEGLLENVESRQTLAGGNALDRASFFVTSKGWKFLQGDSSKASSKSVFVAMWFSDFTKSLREVIRKVVKNNGYDAIFVDELPTRSDLTGEQKRDLARNSTIDNMIIANIRRAKFVVVDLSCFPGEQKTSEKYKREDGTPESRDIVCAGAYFEAGYATALEKPIIYLVNNKQMPHFDVNHIPYITWDENRLEDLERALSNAISARGL